MRYEFTQADVTTEQVNQSVIQCLDRLQQKRQLDDAVHDEFSCARVMFEALPLSTDVYGLAFTRLNSRQHYLRYTSQKGLATSCGN